jgi:hypothetical protein
MVYHAAVRGIKLDEVESKLEGDLDLRGFLAMTDDVRPGYEEIRVKTLKDLTRLSPVYDVVSSGTNVDVQIERK